MLMLANDRAHVDPNNVPLASLVAQEENVGVNFIRNNNFNNNAYRDNFASNNYRPYPSNSDNGYLGRNKMPSEERILEVERATKNFMHMQYEQNKLFTKTMEEQSALLKTISHQLDNLNRDIPELQAKVSKAETSISFLSNAQSSLINRMAAKLDPFAATNAIQVRIDESVRMLAELHARWEREDEMARNMNVCTITTSSDVVSNASNPLTLIGAEKTPTPCVKKPKTAKTFSTKSAEFFWSMGDNSSTYFNDFDVVCCNISKVILFLQKLALSPNASFMNVAFTKHITNALMQIREEKLKQKVSIPKKLKDGWEPIIDMNVNDFDCHALCDLGASISIMPRKIYDMLSLPPLENCYFDVPLANFAKKKPLGRINDVLIIVNNNLAPVDFLVLDVECNASCPIILGRPFLRTVGAIIDMEEGTIKYQFPLKKGMEHFPRKRKKLLFDSILRSNYELDASSLDVT
jgi:hypothetical protein